jgi:hypothetical protein
MKSSDYFYKVLSSETCCDGEILSNGKKIVAFGSSGLCVLLDTPPNGTLDNHIRCRWKLT